MVGLAAVLVGSAAYGAALAVTGEQLTDAARRAMEVSRVYDRARSAVSDLESVTLRFLLEPSDEHYGDAVAELRDLQGALADVQAEADLTGSADAAEAAELLGQFGDSLHRVTLAVRTRPDGPAPDAERQRAEGLFDRVERLVAFAAEEAGDTAARHVEQLEERQHVTLVLSPLLGTIAVILLVVCWRAVRRYRVSIEHLALHDDLTGLANRKRLQQLTDAAIITAARSGTTVALVLLDLDGFKEINDVFGHGVGDELLSAVAERIGLTVRATDVVARLGADEFAVLITRLAGPATALMVVDKVRAAIEQPFKVADVSLDVEVSCGVALAPEHAITSESLLTRADVAMQESKRARRGVVVYEPDMDATDPDRLSLLGDLRRALDHDELVVHYQPKATLPDGRLAGVEALVRWQHPTRGLLMPDRFIALAEQTSMIHVLTRQVLCKSLAQCRRWLDDGHRVPVAVNISTRCLLGDTLVPMVLSELEAAGVPADLLELEITETAAMTDPTGTRRVLAQLHDKGVAVAVDDFGTGYASLTYLHTLPVTTLKIDRSFVSGMLVDHSDRVIVQAVIDLGRNLGLTVVAEGVEDAATLDALAEAGCELGQGYHWSRPVPADELAPMIRSASAAAPR